jgi:hypothetical protein
MKKIRIYLLIIVLGLGFFGCKKFDTLLENPNLPTATSADVDLYLNQVQLSANSLFQQSQNLGSALTRMTTFFGPTYTNAYSAQEFDGIFSTAYTGVLKNVNVMIPLARAQGKFFHSGIGLVLKAQTLMTLVDLFGDVPFSEANLGVENQNPKVDKGADIYAAAISMLDSAIVDLGKPTVNNPITILYSQTTKAGWIKVANSLKLRAYITTRLVDNTAGAKIQALVTNGKLITTNADEFTFRYGTNQANPNNRHPRYNANYVASGGAGDYLGVYFMFALRFEKGIEDPRTRYYFYRQSTTSPGNIQEQPCAFQSRPSRFSATTPFCEIGLGYRGRDHGDNSGIPPDGLTRTVPGIYPAGGKFDCNEGVRTVLNDGGKGAGISPIWMSFFTDFVLAEAALTTTGFTGNARTLFINGVTKSIARVMAFPAELGVPTTNCTSATAVSAISATAVTRYITRVTADYDSAATPDAKLDVVLKEYYIALYGNGTEAYNMYRRTSRPRGLQPTILPNEGPFIRSFLYPSSFVNLNTNAKQKPDFAQRVFWDTNPDPLF